MSLVRKTWMSACVFHDLSEKQVLDAVAARVQTVQKPLVLLDLDSTLYEVGPRTQHLLHEWASMPENSVFERVREGIRKLKLEQIGYSIRDTFLVMGIDPTTPDAQDAFESVRRHWMKGFFSSDYLKHDRPYPGAAAFTRKLHGMGAEIVYLTGRDEPNMGVGTRECLLRDGFPWEEDRTHLLMKRDFADEDLTHKTQAASYIREHGTLIASFENEPKNLVALHALFPDAMHVFVETVCSDHEAAPAEGLYRIPGFVSAAII